MLSIEVTERDLFTCVLVFFTDEGKPRHSQHWLIEYILAVIISVIIYTDLGINDSITVCGFYILILKSSKAKLSIVIVSINFNAQLFVIHLHAIPKQACFLF